MFEEAVTYQFIGNVTNGATDGDAITTIAAGSVALAKVTDDTVEETNVSTSTTVWYQVVQKLADGTYVRSPKFKPGNCTISGTSYAAATEQISYWGYNGTSGDLGTITSGNVYTLSVLLKQTAPTANNTPMIKTIPWQATAATQYNVANGLATIFRKVFKREPYPMIKCELVNSGTSVATSSGVLVCVNGSKTVTIAEDDANDAGKYDTDGSTMVAGDILRIGHATTNTYPVYKIAAISGAGTSACTITLDREYEGTSESVAAASAGVIAAASEGDYGLKFTGLNRFATKAFKPLTDYYSKVRFDITSADFDADVVETLSQAATEGVGTAYEVAQREVYTSMNQGAGTWLDKYSPNVHRSETDLSTPKTYDVMTIEGSDSAYVPVGVGLQPVSKFKIFICTEVSLNGDAVDAALGLAL